MYLAHYELESKLFFIIIIVVVITIDIVVIIIIMCRASGLQGPLPEGFPPSLPGDDPTSGHQPCIPGCLVLP